jgi:hypothetical protein
VSGLLRNTTELLRNKTDSRNNRWSSVVETKIENLVSTRRYHLWFGSCARRGGGGHP